MLKYVIGLLKKFGRKTKASKEQVQKESAPNNPNLPVDLYERLWTGQGIEVRAGEKIGERVYVSAFNEGVLFERDRDFALKALDTLEKHGYEADCAPYKRGFHFREIMLMTIRKSGQDSSPAEHELGFDVWTAEGQLSLGAEFEAIDKEAKRYNLKLFQKSLEGHRFAYPIRPQRKFLDSTLGLMYDILKRTGYLAQENPSLV